MLMLLRQYYKLTEAWNFMSQICAKSYLDLVSDQNFHPEHETVFLYSWGKDLSAKG